MLDPAAQVGCRVWVTCPGCGVEDPDGAYLLGYDVASLWCQCGSCEHRWYFETGFGVGGAPARDPWWPATG